MKRRHYHGAHMICVVLLSLIYSPAHAQGAGIDTCTNIKKALMSCTAYSCITFQGLTEEQEADRRRRQGQLHEGMNPMMAMGIIRGGATEKAIRYNIDSFDGQFCHVIASEQKSGKESTVTCKLRRETIQEWASTYQEGTPFKLQRDPILSRDCNTRTVDKAQEYMGGGGRKTEPAQEDTYDDEYYEPVELDQEEGSSYEWYE